VKTPKAPKAPDPKKTAQAQTESNIGTGIANTVMGNANEIGPTGTIRYNQIGSQKVNGVDVPQYERVTTLSPEQQAIYNQQTQFQQGLGQTGNTLLGNLSSQLGTPIDPSQATARASGMVTGPQFAQAGQGPQFSQMGQGPQFETMANNDWSQDRQRVEDALYSRINPQLDRDRAALESRLANQGIRAGSEAYREAIALADRQANDARMQTVLAGGQEQSRLAGLDMSRLGFNNNVGQQGFQNQLTTNTFNNNAAQQGFQNQMAGAQFNNNAAQQGFQNDLTGRNFQNATRDAELNEQMRLRSNGINELNSLIGGTQVQTPQGQAFNAGGIAGTDVAGITQQGYQNAYQNYQNQLAQQNSMLGGIAGGVGSLLALPMTGGASLGGSLMGSMFGGIGR
jgi:hypothetical protein